MDKEKYLGECAGCNKKGVLIEEICEECLEYEKPSIAYRLTVIILGTIAFTILLLTIISLIIML